MLDFVSRTSTATVIFPFVTLVGIDPERSVLCFGFDVGISGLEGSTS
jgi:hypothetical protein